MAITPEQYSFVVTWTYFSVYFAVFFIVSIVCAMKVHKEYKKYNLIQERTDSKAWTKKGMITNWGKLVWQKKKVYFQLIPHFFDQATDCGVIFEYWRLRNDENVGINTLWLFGTSIFVIILHRIISSFAIYQLTRNKSFILYQLLDVLMIRCIWTNYQLGTDEPSNSQRYLQVLEAIFESAPQILISTAFLIKSQLDSVNPIIVISLITSFWSLSARVSSDDKQMFKDDWKSFKHSDCLCINPLWIVRVLWRFLEITSRIVLLAVVWINLGGLSVFIILGLECIYLSIVSFGLGTVDLMGNVIYLMAANSTKKSEYWAVTMTKVFWAYRVISAYLLLVICTIFAIETKTDPHYVPDYETRNEQTIVNSTGRALFIFCWVSTPIWQWIGAIAIFDFGNLASVGRDVAQLVINEQFLDVLELIKFGADFDEEQTLKSILSHNEKHVDIEEICLNRIKEKKMLNHTFFRACNNNNENMIKYLLLKTDVNINNTDEFGRSGLFYTVENGLLKTVQLLHKHGAKNDIFDNDGLTAIHYAFEQNKIHQQIKPDEEKNDESRLFNIVKYFIDSQIGIGMMDNNGDTMLDVAVRTNQAWSIQEFLIMNGAWKAKKINFSDINELDKANGLMLCYGFLRESESLLIQNKQIFDKCVEFADIGLDIGLDINVDINALEIEKKKKNLLKYKSKKAISWETKEITNNDRPILFVGCVILIVISIPLF
eukprot:41316_1